MLWECNCWNYREGDCYKIVESDTSGQAREIFEKWLDYWYTRAYRDITVREAYVLTKDNTSCEQVSCSNCKHVEYKKDGKCIFSDCKYKNKCSLKTLEMRGIIDGPFFDKAEARKELS